MKTVKEVSRIAGVSVRTLHYYDAIGLLKPAEVTPAGYRLYDDPALARLQSILLFRELQFPLKEIKTILDSPDFIPSEALAQQISLLELQYERLGEVIAFARKIQKSEVQEMNFNVFDKSEIEQYRAEAKARWGSSGAYQEYREKGIEGEFCGHTAKQIMRLFSEIGRLRHLPPSADSAQEKVRELQELITSDCYTCTVEMLRELGRMYVEDERFKRRIDDAGGDGTAAFAKEAIAIYCSKREI